jgi:hypothetical protein
MPHQLILFLLDESSLFAWSTKPRAALIPEVRPIRVAASPMMLMLYNGRHG